MILENTNLQHFADSFNLNNLIHEATCFKGLPSCIDLVITNRKPYLKNNCVAATEMSDFQKSQVMKVLTKHKFYRNYKNFDKDGFNKVLKLKLDSLEELNYYLFDSCSYKNENFTIK